MQCIRCGLLLQMSHVTWSVCLCVDHSDVPSKTAKPIEMLFGGLTQVGPRNRVFDVVKMP